MPKITRQITTVMHNPENAFSLIRHRLGSRFSQYFAPLMQYHALSPEAINIYPTDRCNLKCMMCFEKLRQPRPELTPDDWQCIIDHIATFKPRIHLSGGEPLLYKDIDTIITHIKRRRLFLAITTNGTFLEKYAETIFKCGVNAITVSIDGPRDIHDQIRGVAGCFDSMVRGLNHLIKHRGRAVTPVLRINSMINASNPAAMQEVIRTAVHYGAKNIQFIHPMFVSEQDLTAHRHYLSTRLGLSMNYWRGAQEVAYKEPDIAQIQKICKNLQRETALRVEIFPAFTNEQIQHYYSMDTRFHAMIRGQCRAMWTTATILPSGDLESCPDIIAGNCRVTSFRQLWNSKLMQELRMRIHQKQIFTVCRACCFSYM